MALGSGRGDGKGSDAVQSRKLAGRCFQKVYPETKQADAAVATEKISEVN